MLVQNHQVEGRTFVDCLNHLKDEKKALKSNGKYDAKTENISEQTSKDGGLFRL